MRITKVYTRVGDGGDTYLGGGHKVPKESLRIEAYGTVDELNSFLGVALAAGLDSELVTVISRIQNDLFHLGSDLCLLEEDKKKLTIPQIEKRHVDQLEREIDRLQEHLKPLEEFILPGGSPGAAHLHAARTVCRRAERIVVALGRKGVYDLTFSLDDHWAEVEALLKKYRTRGISLADACLIRSAEVHGEARILTFDSDFTIYRWARRKVFQLL